MMADYEETLKACMEEAGMSQNAIARALVLYESNAHDELVRFLRFQRCELVDEMHESQRRVDRVDYLIRQSEKKLITERT